MEPVFEARRLETVQPSITHTEECAAGPGPGS